MPLALGLINVLSKIGLDTMIVLIVYLLKHPPPPQKKKAHHTSNPRRVGTACNVLCDVIYVSYLCLVVWLFHLKKYQKNGTSVSDLQIKAAWQAGSAVKLLRNNCENAQPCNQKQQQKQKLNKQACHMPKKSQHHP